MVKKVKVLQLGSPTGLYGAERWILALIKHLDPTKIESWVASIRDEPHLKVPLCIEAQKLGVRTHIFNCYGKINFSAIQQIKEFIRQNGIDIIHTHGYKADLIGYFATRGTSCKIVSTPHGWTRSRDLKLKIYANLDRMIFPLLDAVAPLSDELDRQLRRIPGLKSKLHLIRNGVNIDEIKDVGHIAKEISAFKSNGEVVIGYIGRLTPGKGLDILLNAVKEYGEPNWRVAIVGDGEQCAELQSMVTDLDIGNRVTFFGFRPDRLAFLKGFDVFVLPSRSEGIPRCLMEAMIAGVAVVASDIPGCRYLVDGKTTGLLFQSDRELAESIKRLISDPLLRESLSRSGQEFIQQRFSAARMAKQYEELFFTLCR